MLKTFFQKLHFSPQLISSGVVLAMKFEIPEALVFLKTVPWNSSDQPLIVFLIIKIIEKLTRLCVDLSHLRESRFKHSFQNILNVICSCGFDIESTTHYILNLLRLFSEKTSYSFATAFV